MQNRQRHSFKMTVGEAEHEATGRIPFHTNDQEPEAEPDVPPARPIRTTSYLQSNATQGSRASQGHRMSATAAAAAAATQARQASVSANQLGSKDLIIRMLAEIFQVQQDESGQVRWQQVSTSLVPISLYSRTTSKWLEYLLEASCSMQVNDPASTMSPDSRDFLLQLQQFHHQQQQQQTRLANNLAPRHLRQQQQQYQQRLSDSIVFQVVGHDFVDGQCRKILNVKVRQPGVRLGRASEYFVYWKELGSQSVMGASVHARHRHLYHQQLSASSFADSSVSHVPAHNVLSPMENMQMLNYPAQTGADYRFSAASQTWGLNFASINDAKLFYDICSLNLVNLDFNSEYLKQLTTISDKGRQEANFSSAVAGGMAPNSYYMLNANSMNNNLTATTTAAAQRLARSRSAMSRAPRQVSMSSTTAKDQLRGSTLRSSELVGEGHHYPVSSRCPSCLNAFEMIAGGKRGLSSSSTARTINLNDAMMANSVCPIHGDKPARSSTLRARSRSTTRQSVGQATTARAADDRGMTRARSFSTPASPELDDCPVHRDLAHRAYQHKQHQRQQQTEPMRLMGNSSAADSQPEKPARGLLRSSYLKSGGSQEKSNSKRSAVEPQQQQKQQQPHRQDRAPIVPQHSSGAAAPPDRGLHTKRNTKTRYMGHLHNLARQREHEEQEQQQRQVRRHQSGPQQGTLEGSYEMNSGLSELELVAGVGVGSGSRGVSGKIANENNRSLFQRGQESGSGGGGGSAGGTFDAITSRRDAAARSARARYANSRNMKEFLSLDAGGVQSTAGLQRLQTRAQKAQNRVSHEQGGQVDNSTNPKLTGGNAGGGASGRPKDAQSKSIDKSATHSTTAKVGTMKEALSSSDSGAGMNLLNGSARGPSSKTGPTITHDPSRCTVSTTTEDLPLDTLVKQRMLKLTSEEAISEEATEPRSASVSTVVVAHGGQVAPTAAESEKSGGAGASGPSRNAESRLEARQMRAISLGPSTRDDNANFRGRSGRSDASRRRSLERSMRIEQDTILPASSFMKLARLSPLPQSSTSPQAPGGCSTADGASPSNEGCSPPRPGIVDSRELERSRRVLGEGHTSIADYNIAGHHHHQQQQQQQQPLTGHGPQRQQEQHRYVVGPSSYARLADMQLTNEALLLRAEGDGMADLQDARAGRDQIAACQSVRRNYVDASGVHGKLDYCAHSGMLFTPSRDRAAVAASGNKSMTRRQITSHKSAPDIGCLVGGSEQSRPTFGKSHAGNEDNNNNDDDDDDDDCYHGSVGSGEEQLDDEEDHYFRRDQRGQQQQQRFVNMLSKLSPQAPRGPISNLSSYAVPLCATVRRPGRALVANPQQPSRQCRSCPNSLLRKRRGPTTATTGLPTASQLPPRPPVAESQFSALDQYCSCHTQLHGQAANDRLARVYSSALDSDTLQQPEHRACVHCGNLAAAGLNCLGCANEALVRHSGCWRATTRQSCQSEQAHQAARLLCCRHRIVNYYREHQCADAPLEGISAHSCGLSQQLDAQQLDTDTVEDNQRHDVVCYHTLQASRSQQHSRARPHSSQSVRSPTQYGLYESDCDDHEPNAGSVQSQDADFCRQQSVRLKPVQGYDRTLARSQMKSRQRSKSQPPSGSEEPETNAAAFHLTKSMENVEKLIKEVQNELRALKRQPLGTAKIDMRAGRAEINQTQLKWQGDDAPLGAACRHAGHRRPDEVSREETDRDKRGFEAGSSSNNNNNDNNNNNNNNGSALKVSLTSATRRAGQFKCVGAIRKAGFLSVKKWILKRRQSIELARKQGWKRYWVCLRGTALLFHSVIEVASDNSQEQVDPQPAFAGAAGNQIDLLSWIEANCSASQLSSLASLLQAEEAHTQVAGNLAGGSRRQPFNMSKCFIEKEPRHLIIIDGAIAQPIPEHPRRDFVFCLSTTFGDAYLFQAGCKLESDNWISAVHNACAASIARDLVRDEAIKLFETKIKHFELEAEKKLFLRQRLESRLNSMSSMIMCHHNEPATREARPFSSKSNNNNSAQVAGDDEPGTHSTEPPPEDPTHKTTTMRSLLSQLGQQLLALDTYIEQLHCEVYQLQCYLSSCSAQHMFYQKSPPSAAWSRQPVNERRDQPAGATRNAIQNDLPNPKSLLMHVSKPTKLMLIKLGVFTVSSFHAYIHARQESANSILQTIRQQQSNGALTSSSSPHVELRIRSRSISETLVTRCENVQLASETENLIEMSDLRTAPVVLSKLLLDNIRARHGTAGSTLFAVATTHDDRYTIEDRGDCLLLSVKMNSSSTSSSIIKQVLKIIAPECSETEFLSYYLRLVTLEGRKNGDETICGQVGRAKCDSTADLACVPIRRDETLGGWSNFAHIEMLEKVVFRVELTRSRVDENDEAGSAPFGVSVEGQLITSESDSLLNVYCSYIEWGSIADKAGLQDEDELLMINSIPLADLDLMFVECIIQEASKLKIVVRSSRCKEPAKAKRLDRITWRSLDDPDNSDSEGRTRRTHQTRSLVHAAIHGGGDIQALAGSQVISDEYLTSLVCPPPPARSSAFLRTDTNLLRQKSDLSMNRATSSSMGESATVCDLAKSRSQHRIDLSCSPPPPSSSRIDAESCGHSSNRATRPLTVHMSSADLARQLLQRSERLTKLLSKEEEQAAVAGSGDLDKLLTSAHSSLLSDGEGVPQKEADQNQVERLRKSVLELIETEYAYIRHLETISEHYMSPLRETSFLDIPDLRAFNETVLGVLTFQHAFFGQLMDGIFEDCKLDFAAGVHQSVARDHFERFNKIVQHVESLRTVASLEPTIRAIAKIFLSESEKFRVYAAYCAAYSKLQTILHPKSAAKSLSQGSNAITSAPLAMNTFLASSLGITHISGLGNFALPQRDFKLLTHGGTLGTGGATTAGGPAASSSTNHGASAVAAATQAQLRKLADFLGSLDSSSSSASFSLPGSSSPDQRAAQQQQQNRESGELTTASTSSKASSTSGQSNKELEASATGSYQKSVHQQNFESYLIKPIQRIVKYPMLLNSILAATRAQPPAQVAGSCSLDDDLQLAIKQMETVINHVNDAQRVHDEYALIFAHIERQFYEQQQSLDWPRSGAAHVVGLFGAHQPTIALNMAQLLYFGPVDWLNLGEFTSKAKKSMQLSTMLFVFESCVVLLCKELIGKANKRKLPLKTTSAHDTGPTATGSRVLPWSSNHSGGGNGSTGSAGHQSSAIVRYQTLIPVSEVQVRSVASDSSAPAASGKSARTADKAAAAAAAAVAAADAASQSSYKWELFRCSSSNSNSSLLTSQPASAKQQQPVPLTHQQRRNSGATGKVYLLASQTNEQRSAFLRKIRFTIRESVRKMSLPPASNKSISSGNRSPTSCSKKLSTSSASSATSAATTTTTTTTNTNTNKGAVQDTNASLASLGAPDTSAAGLVESAARTDERIASIRYDTPPYSKQQVQHETSIEINS